MELLKKLPIPDNMEKSEIVDLLLREEYGYLPKCDAEVIGEEVHSHFFAAGNARVTKLNLICRGEFGEFSFPVTYTRCLAREKAPCFIHLNFGAEIPHKYQPTEEIIDNGYSILSFFYKDVTSDDGDFTNGLAGVIYPNGDRGEYDCGKLGLWAWAAMRVMDYALTLPEIDKDRISVIGHSRLGKTALLAGMLDERFFCAISNDSGCSGAAISRDKGWETIDDICNDYPYWFNSQYHKYRNNEDAQPFDQHYLIAANYPHLVYVASASEDSEANPKNEYLSCIAASGYYEKRGMAGFVHPDRLPEEGESFHDGSIGYHLRKGRHYLSRYDWLRYIEFLNEHK